MRECENAGMRGGVYAIMRRWGKADKQNVVFVKYKKHKYVGNKDA